LRNATTNQKSKSWELILKEGTKVDKDGIKVDIEGNKPDKERT